MSEQCSNALGALICVILFSINPWAATGAAFGCFFFVPSPKSTTGWQRFKLTVFSFGIGLGAGVFWYGGGPPWQEKAMLPAAALSALAAVIFTAFYHVVDRNGPLPEWLQGILDRIPVLKKRGDSDGA